MTEKCYVEVCFYGDRGDPAFPNNYRPELVSRQTTVSLTDVNNTRCFEHNGCMPKRRANTIARRVASSLGIEVKLAI